MSIDKDVAAGVFFIVIGALGLFIGADYAFGTPAKMGAGFVPKLLAWGLIGIGGIIALTGFARRSDGDGMDKWAIGPLLVILAGVLVFGACLEPFGLEGATIGAILIASSGRSPQSPLQIGLMALAIPCLFLSLFPGMSRHIGHNGVMALLIAGGVALTVQWLLYIFKEETRAIIEQLVLGFALAVLSVIVFADFLGLPFKSLFVMQIWLPLKANFILPIIGAVRAFYAEGKGTVMDLLSNLAHGFAVAISVENLTFCLLGALLGTLIGVLPGIGPVPTIAMLLPFTFSLSPIPALIMMAGIYYGAQYGGSTTAILVNMPGESSSVVTCLDGYQMARQGRAGAALSIAAIGSFIAGSFSTLLIAVCANWMTVITQSFGAAEYFSLMIFGLIAAVVLAQGSVLKAVAMIIVGLFLGLIGTDVNTGKQRYTFGIPELSDGIGFVPIALGIFGLAEIMHNLSQKEDRSILGTKITGLFPTGADMRQAMPAIVRGTLIGSLLGVLPGGGAVLSAFSAYTLEKKLARDPERFGRGAIEGVAAPEAANNAGAQTSFIPLLMLGIPPNAVMALMVGAMMIHGIQPGPQVMTKQPDLFWGLIASMWLGNLMLLVINLPLIGIWVRLLSISYNLLFPAILLFCCIGVYSLNNSGFEVGLTAVFGLAGYFFLKTGCEGAPLLLGFVLGPLMEENLRRALLLSQGDATVFVTRPISAVLLALAAGLLVLVVLPSVRATREKAFQE